MADGNGLENLKVGPVFQGNLHTTAAIKIWKEILTNETQAQREWNDKWGFFQAHARGPRRSEVRQRAGTNAAPTRSSSTPALATAGREMLQMTKLPEERSAAGETRSSRSNASVAFQNRHDKLFGLRNHVPRDRYRNPVTSNHELGWGRSLELFGVSEHGLKRCHEVKPEL